jgi:hypothetical protein
MSAGRRSRCVWPLSSGPVSEVHGWNGSSASPIATDGLTSFPAIGTAVGTAIGTAVGTAIGTAIGTERVALRRFPTHLAVLFTALGVALAAELAHSAVLYGLLTSAISVGLLISHNTWIKRRGGQIALMLAAGAILGTVAAGGDLMHVAAEATHMSDVIILILCVALIRPALAELRLDHAIAAIVARAPRPLRGCAILLGVMIAGLGLSFGAVSVFGGSLRGRTDDDATVARAAMRGLSLSMILGPSTASVAAVMAAYPGVSWTDALLVGLPIAAAGIVIGSFGARRLTITAATATATELIRAVMAILAVPAAAMALRLVFGLSMTLAIAVSALFVAGFLLICATRVATRDSPDGGHQALLRSNHQVADAWAHASAETALFLACGLVMGFMREPVVAESARAFVAAVVPSGYPGLIVLTLAVPLVTALGIHPMALFAILAPVLTPSLLGISEPAVFQAWIVAIGLSMIVSPASVLTMTTVSSFGVPATRLCLRGNGLYAAGLALAALLFLPWR